MPEHMKPFMTVGVRAHYSSTNTALPGAYTGEMMAIEELAHQDTSITRSSVGWAGPVKADTWRRFKGQIMRVLGFMVQMGVVTWGKASLRLYVTHANVFFTFLGFVKVSACVSMIRMPFLSLQPYTTESITMCVSVCEPLHDCLSDNFIFKLKSDLGCVCPCRHALAATLMRQ